MLTHSLLSAGGRLASRGLPWRPATGKLQAQLSAGANPLQCQQVRFAAKTVMLSRYGLMPCYTDHMYNQLKDQDQLDSLAYKQIRFPRSWETNSPLLDDVLEKYLRHMMHDGRRQLMYELINNAFYEIKLTQFTRWRKLQAKKHKLAGQTDQAGATENTKPATEITGNDDEDSVELNPLALFHRAIDNCKPAVITSKVKRGGATYQVPTPISAIHSEYLAMKWLNDLVKERPKPRKRHYHEALAQEILDAAENRGKVVKKKDDLHKLAHANKAYAHYRWG